jgi:DNA-binding NarL/FixJ family response regulator
MKVLIADDSLYTINCLLEMLAIYRQVEIVGFYKNGTDTLEAIQLLKPDLAIVDIKMPGLTGLDVLKAIRKENKTIKIIILTFFSFEYFRQMAIQAGADYFFSKTDEFEKLSMVVAEMVEQEELANNSII